MNIIQKISLVEIIFDIVKQNSACQNYEMESVGLSLLTDGFANGHSTCLQFHLFYAERDPGDITDRSTSKISLGFILLPGFLASRQSVLGYLTGK